MTEADLKKILVAHQEWLERKPSGARADLSHKDLREFAAALRGAYLSGANLSGA